MVRLAVAAQVVDDVRRVRGLRADLGALVVQHPQRVDLDPGPGVLVQVEPAQEVLQRGPVHRPAVPVAQAVQQQGELGQAEGAVGVVGGGDRLHVDRRVLGADRLEVELVELPVAARLRALVAERGAAGEDLDRQRALVQVVLEHGAEHAGGELGAQRDLTPAAVTEGVHLLAHDVARLAHTADEEIGVLEHRGLDRCIAGAAGGVGERLAGLGEQRAAGRKVLGDPLRGLEAHGSYSPFWAGFSPVRNGLVRRSSPIVVCGP